MVTRGLYCGRPDVRRDSGRGGRFPEALRGDPEIDRLLFDLYGW